MLIRCQNEEEIKARADQLWLDAKVCMCVVGAGIWPKIKDGAQDCNTYMGTVDVPSCLDKMRSWNWDSCIKPDPETTASLCEKGSRNLCSLIHAEKTLVSGHQVLGWGKVYCEK